jgi:hypothetical protein
MHDEPTSSGPRRVHQVLFFIRNSSKFWPYRCGWAVAVLYHAGRGPKIYISPSVLDLFFFATTAQGVFGKKHQDLCAGTY